MAASHDSQSPPTPNAKRRLTRRELLAQGAALGATGGLLAGCGASKRIPDPLSEEGLITASGLSGESLSPERVRAAKSLIEFNLKHLQVLREFDPDDEEPLTMFRL